MAWLKKLLLPEKKRGKMIVWWRWPSRYVRIISHHHPRHGSVTIFTYRQEKKKITRLTENIYIASVLQMKHSSNRPIMSTKANHARYSSYWWFFQQCGLSQIDSPRRQSLSFLTSFSQSSCFFILKTALITTSMGLNKKGTKNQRSAFGLIDLWRQPIIFARVKPWIFHSQLFQELSGYVQSTQSPVLLIIIMAEARLAWNKNTVMDKKVIVIFNSPSEPQGFNTSWCKWNCHWKWSLVLAQAETLEAWT